MNYFEAFGATLIITIGLLVFGWYLYCWWYIYMNGLQQFLLDDPLSIQPIYFIILNSIGLVAMVAWVIWKVAQ